MNRLPDRPNKTKIKPVAFIFWLLQARLLILSNQIQREKTEKK
ncbi:hypothetical protein [Thiomicrorhabdus marina]|nr:hypothetical protein [Thiomicrorhabdus marina]